MLKTAVAAPLVVLTLLAFAGGAAAQNAAPVKPAAPAKPAAAAPAGPKEDKYVGYYYPKPTTVEEFTSSMSKIGRAHV